MKCAMCGRYTSFATADEIFALLREGDVVRIVHPEGSYFLDVLHSLTCVSLKRQAKRAGARAIYLVNGCLSLEPDQLHTVVWEVVPPAHPITRPEPGSRPILSEEVREYLRKGMKEATFVTLPSVESLEDPRFLKWDRVPPAAPVESFTVKGPGRKKPGVPQ